MRYPVDLPHPRLTPAKPWPSPGHACVWPRVFSFRLLVRTPRGPFRTVLISTVELAPRRSAMQPGETRAAYAAMNVRGGGGGGRWSAVGKGLSEICHKPYQALNFFKKVSLYPDSRIALQN